MPKRGSGKPHSGADDIGSLDDRFYCPFPGCKRSFAELWRLKVHYRAPPDVRGSGKERGHGAELPQCPKCLKELVPGKHHVGCVVGRSAPRQAAKRVRMVDGESLQQEDQHDMACYGLQNEHSTAMPCWPLRTPQPAATASCTSATVAAAQHDVQRQHDQHVHLALLSLDTLAASENGYHGVPHYGAAMAQHGYNIGHCGSGDGMLHSVDSMLSSSKCSTLDCSTAFTAQHGYMAADASTVSSDALLLSVDPPFVPSHIDLKPIVLPYHGVRDAHNIQDVRDMEGTPTSGLPAVRASHSMVCTGQKAVTADSCTQTSRMVSTCTQTDCDDTDFLLDGWNSSAQPEDALGASAQEKGVSCVTPDAASWVTDGPPSPPPRPSHWEDLPNSGLLFDFDQFTDGSGDCAMVTVPSANDFDDLDLPPTSDLASPLLDYDDADMFKVFFEDASQHAREATVHLHHRWSPAVPAVPATDNRSPQHSVMPPMVAHSQQHSMAQSCAGARHYDGMSHGDARAECSPMRSGSASIASGCSGVLCAAHHRAVHDEAVAQPQLKMEYATLRNDCVYGGCSGLSSTDELMTLFCKPC